MAGANYRRAVSSSTTVPNSRHTPAWHLRMSAHRAEDDGGGTKFVPIRRNGRYRNDEVSEGRAGARPPPVERYGKIAGESSNQPPFPRGTLTARQSRSLASGHHPLNCQRRAFPRGAAALSSQAHHSAGSGKRRRHAKLSRQTDICGDCATPHQAHQRRHRTDTTVSSLTRRDESCAEKQPGRYRRGRSRDGRVEQSPMGINGAG